REVTALLEKVKAARPGFTLRPAERTSCSLFAHGGDERTALIHELHQLAAASGWRRIRPRPAG
ncbi:hypothetical protein VB636_09940, partial [Paracoccus sp. APAP_BH8]|uniref:hypothetical protein n=1 Tax=Paracoccus sp. APAP_BH8 TaxID=3110237 RepID=UPI002FD83A55